MPGQVEVIPASAEDQPVLANMLELYAHDFSEFLDIDLNHEGRFGYDKLPLYWREPGRHPFLIRWNGKLAGFVLVKRGSETSGDETVWDMAEFFVLRRYLKRGIGAAGAHAIWSRFPGKWEVRVMQSNQAATTFWQQAINKFTGQSVAPIAIIHHQRPWHVFGFESR